MTEPLYVRRKHWASQALASRTGSSRDKKFLSDGYVLAYKTNESYAGVNYEIGVLDTNGQWVVPLAGSNPLLSSGMECSQKASKRA